MAVVAITGKKGGTGKSTIAGMALSDQIKSQDWQARRAEFMGTLPPPVVDEITAKVKTLLEE